MILERQHKKAKKQRRALASRTVKKSRNYPKGVPVRVSAMVHDILWKKKTPGESWDCFFRRLLNLPGRDGINETPLFECWILRSTGETFSSKSLARGQSVKNGVLKGYQGKFEEPRKVREVI